MSTDEMIELTLLRNENKQLRERLELANKIISEQVCDAARFIADHYVRRREEQIR